MMLWQARGATLLLVRLFKSRGGDGLPRGVLLPRTGNLPHVSLALTSIIHFTFSDLRLRATAMQGRQPGLTTMGSSQIAASCP